MARRSKSTEVIETQENGGLTPQQEQVILAIVSGSKQKDAAEQAGVAEETVSRWRNHDAGFIAALNSQRRALWDGQTDRLRSMLPKALDVLETALGDGDVSVARDIVKSCGLADVARDIGSGDAERVQLELSSQRVKMTERLLAELE